MNVILEDLHRQAHGDGKPPEYLTIRADQVEQLAEELSELSFNKEFRITADDIRVNGCHCYGLPVRITADNTAR